MPTDLQNSRVVLRCRNCHSKMAGPASKVKGLALCPKCETGELVLEREYPLASGKVVPARTTLQEWKIAVEDEPLETSDDSSPDLSGNSIRSKQSAEHAESRSRSWPVLAGVLGAAFLAGCLSTVALVLIFWPDGEKPIPNRPTLQSDSGTSGVAEFNDSLRDEDESSGIDSSINTDPLELEQELRRVSDELAAANAEARHYKTSSENLQTLVDELQLSSGEHDGETSKLREDLDRAESQLELAQVRVKQLLEVQQELFDQLDAGVRVVDVSPLFAPGFVVSRSYFSASNQIYVSVVRMDEGSSITMSSVQFTDLDGKSLGNRLTFTKGKAADGWWSGTLDVSNTEIASEMLSAPRARLSTSQSTLVASVNFPSIRAGGYTGLPELVFSACDVSEIRSLGDYFIYKYFTFIYTADESAFPRTVKKIWFELRPWGSNGRAKSTGESYEAEVEELDSSNGFKGLTATVRIPAWAPSGVIWFVTIDPAPKDTRVARPPKASRNGSNPVPPRKPAGSGSGAGTYGSALKGKSTSVARRVTGYRKTLLAAGTSYSRIIPFGRLTALTELTPCSGCFSTKSRFSSTTECRMNTSCITSRMSDQ